MEGPNRVLAKLTNLSYRAEMVYAFDLEGTRDGALVGEKPQFESRRTVADQQSAGLVLAFLLGFCGL